MSDQNGYRLADAWIEYFRLRESEAEASDCASAVEQLADGDLFSAFEQLTDLVRDQPEIAWLIIQQLWTLDQTERMLAIIAAGPVEDLLCWHGPNFIERVERLAEQDPLVKKMLGAVWGRNRMAEDVWHRLRTVAGPDF